MGNLESSRINYLPFRLRKTEKQTTEEALIQRFQKVADVALFENHTTITKEEEEKVLIQR